jgi:photosystem II PsbY protein
MPAKPKAPILTNSHLTNWHLTGGPANVDIDQLDAPAQRRPGAVRKISLIPLSCLPMDARLVLVAAPILLAASWAVFHIGRAAVGQLQLMLKRARA